MTYTVEVQLGVHLYTWTHLYISDGTLGGWNDLVSIVLTSYLLQLGATTDLVEVSDDNIMVVSDALSATDMVAMVVSDALSV